MITLKKKSYEFENEVTEETSVEVKCIPIFYGDRFIPRRFSLKNYERNLMFSSNRPTMDALSLACTNKDYWRGNNYLPTINCLMQITKDRILDLMDPVVQSTGFVIRSRCQYSKKKSWVFNDWPCRPRSKPSATLDSTFDLPDHSSACDPNLVGWSSRGHIAVSFGRNIIIWLGREDVTMAFDIKCPSSLAYSPNGEFLAIGCKSCELPVVELWDVSHSKDFSVVSGKVLTLKHVAVQCIEWTLSGKQIVCGTHYGCMYVLSIPEMSTIKKIRHHDLPIQILRFSPTMRFLASGDSEGNIVIYTWNMCNVYLYVRSRRKLNVVFDWHPWSGVDLAISEHVPASIVILNVPSKKITAFYQQNRKNLAISYISFSKLTAELLVNIAKQDGGSCSEPKVLVMSSLDKVVDILKIEDGGARFLMWSPDGSKVATTNNDEDLSFWHFFSLRKPKYLKELNGTKDKSVESKFGHQFKKWSFLK